jgi:hypothetical protein
MIIKPVYLADPREAASHHLCVAVVEGGAHQSEVHVALCNVWRDPVVAWSLYRIWAGYRRLSRDHATIEREAPHAA